MQIKNDILISFDTTGSMSACIKQVRRNVVQLVTELFQFKDTRIGIITHGDYCDNPIMTNLSFSSELSQVVQFVERAPDTYGGDAPECYELVLSEARIFDWQAENRIMLLIGDSTPHHPSESQNRRNLDWKIEAEQLASYNGVKIYAVQCLNHRSSDSFYDGLARIGGTQKLSLHQFADINKLLTAVFYKQVGDEYVVRYGEELKKKGSMNRNIASILDSLLEAGKFIGGIGGDADLEAVDPTRFQILEVDYDCSIKDFVEDFGARFKVGRGFYELTKRVLVQEYKEVVLRDKNGDMFSGAKARDLIGLPLGERGHVTPKDIGYEIFIQSTSHNRKLLAGTKFLYEIDKS